MFYLNSVTLIYWGGNLNLPFYQGKVWPGLLNVKLRDNERRIYTLRMTPGDQNGTPGPLSRDSLLPFCPPPSTPTPPRGSQPYAFSRFVKAMLCFFC